MKFMLQGAGLRTALGLGCIAMLLGTGAQAGNGLNDVGYGAESAGMAGADIAIARDTAALNTNPAGLSQIEGQMLDVLVEPYTFIGHRHKDEFGNNVQPNNRDGAALGGGYARRLQGTGLVVGLGVFFQGGAGLAYKDLKTPFGTRDDLTSLFGSLKLAPGFAWQASEQLSVGAALGLSYSSARQKVFYETSTAGDPQTGTPAFSGLRIDDLAGMSANVKLGLQYRPSPDWVLALVYTSKAPLRLEDGELRLNNTGSGGGVVRYRDTRITGLAFAPEAGIGARWRASDRLQLTAEVNWLDWSSAMEATRLTARDPDTAAAPSKLVIETPLNWRDQVLFAAGGIWQWTPATELIFGASYARQPIPKQSVSPTFALLGETSLSAGFTHQIGSQWRLLVGGTYQPAVEMSYTSPLLGESSERWEAIGVYITMSRRW